MKFHLLLAAYLFSIIIINNNSFAQLPSLVSKTEKAVFKIETYNEFGIVSATGTGFFINRNGTGITAWHVLEDAKFAFIKDYKGKKYRIKKITRSNLDADFVEFVLDTRETQFPFIPITSEIPGKGSNVFTIGYPEGFENIVSSGVVAGHTITDGVKVIQTTSAISHGSSGGPLLNMQGQVFGVMSYSYSKGQNLNFAYALSERSKMKNDSLIDLMSDTRGEYYLLNIKAKNDPNLSLKSIEFKDSATFLNFSYTNLSIANGNDAFVYCNTKNKEETYYIKGKDSLTKHFVSSSSLSETIEDAPKIKLGQALHFYLIFDVKNIFGTFDLIETMKGSDWSFHDVKIPAKQYLTSDMFDDYNNSEFHETRMNFLAEEYSAVKKEIEVFKDSLKNNELLEQLSSITNYSLGLYDETIQSVQKLIKLNPTQADYYADLYTLYIEMDSTAKALECISKAIKYNSEYIEYHYMRAELNFSLKRWEEAIADYDQYIESGRKEFAAIYLSRGIAKSMIKDNTACADFEKAKDLAESDREWDKINKEHRKYCK